MEGKEAKTTALDSAGSSASGTVPPTGTGNVHPVEGDISDDVGANNIQSNPSVPEGLQNELEKIKGDMIGDTVYSERWVLKTMMEITKKFSDYCVEDEIRELEPSLEEDVCTIWDMSAEPDVAKFLIRHGILDLTAAIIGQCQNARLMEMMIGVLGNLACQPDIRAKISERENLVFTLVASLRYPDTLALVQLVRLIRTCLWGLRTNTPSGRNPWVEALSQPEASSSLQFIIGSSVEEDLLTASFHLLETLVYIKLPEDQGFLGKYFSSSGMVSCLVEGLRELTAEASGDDNDDDEESNDAPCIASNKVEEACRHWVSALHGISLCDEGQQAVREHASSITKYLQHILRHFLDQNSWKEYLDEYSDFLMCAANVLSLLLPTDFNSECLGCVVTLLERVQGLGEVVLQESLEDCLATVAAAEGVQGPMLTALDQCHAPEVELCFRAVAKQDKALLAQLLAELQCTSKHERLREIASRVLADCERRPSAEEAQR